jgi:alpha-amylase/alpha-mannosidase (GH57 family)
MHQPDYRDAHGSISQAPWVRLRGTKDYLDMLILATEFDNIKVTFNLVPSLIEQFDFYANGGSDIHLELSRLDPLKLNPHQVRSLLQIAFNCHPETMIKSYPRYYSLYKKWKDAKKFESEIALNIDEMTDLQVWSNLTWIDPLFRSSPGIKELFAKAEGFTENDKLILFNWQKEQVSKIIPAYQNAFKRGKIDISFSPYFHPILPLICDTNSAKEAVPEITLPDQRFAHPEDARKQVQMSMELYDSLFNQRMKGMWPSEGSISEDVANLCSQLGLLWIAGDEQVLFRSLHKSGLDTSANHPYALYQHSSGLKLLFRDHTLSDKVGFVYAAWNPEKAAADFISHIKSSAARLGSSSEELIVPVILDGENSWEFYENDGLDFLKTLYQQLSQDKEIQTVTMTEAAQTNPARPLKSIFAGSWINHNFRIWIGHYEDNTAWDYLKNARDFLVDFEKNNPEFDPAARKAAWREIYIAQGSDWFWWYGDEHRGPDNYLFDNLFRGHLERVYELLGAKAPIILRLPIITQMYAVPILMPDALLTPVIDGRITHFYEWFGAGRFQCISSESTMHRVFWILSAIHFGFDHNKLYLRLDFPNPRFPTELQSPEILIRLLAKTEFVIKIPITGPFLNSGVPGKYSASFSEILELAIERNFLWTEGYGKLGLRVEIYDKGQLIEKWPERENIVCDLPEKNNEIFWH